MAYPVVPYTDWVKMGQFAQLDDDKVFYVHKGKGPPLIMIHHNGGNSWWWCRVLDSFAQHYSVYALDLPGFARSETPPLPYDIPDFADALEQFMGKMGIEKAHLLGNSCGSQVSVDLATTRPSLVKTLVLDIFPHWTRAQGKKLWMESYRPRYLDEHGVLKPFDQWDARGDTFADMDEQARKIALQRHTTDFKEHGSWFINVLTIAQLRYDVNPRLPLIKAPTLVVVGEDGSKHIRQGQEQMVGNIKGGRLVVIPKSGNRCQFEQPEAYARVVLDFLRASE